MSAYTKEETQRIIDEYTADPTRATVDRLASELDRPIRSIIGKLSSAGIYKPPAKLTKNGEPIVIKSNLAKDIGEWFGIEVPSLVKASRAELRALHAALSNPDYLRAHLVDLEDESN